MIGIIPDLKRRLEIYGMRIAMKDFIAFSGLVESLSGPQTFDN